MINSLRVLVQRPERGWDPVTFDYARKYADHEYAHLDGSVVDRMEELLGGLRSKRILDLGGGPGQYALAFARRGATVTWHDVSRSYLEIAQTKAREAGVQINFSLGRLEAASFLGDEAFDLVFNRLSWSYCVSDSPFAQMIFTLLRHGGFVYVDVNTPAYGNPSRIRRILHWLDSRMGVKVGHLYPPRGRVERLLRDLPFRILVADYSSTENDRVIAVKCGANGP